ncbi:hypothetical protein B0H15DRAFT_1022637 [Mycena belliarum]|uniref:Uncharacterized protein n=1 Tax=Mycena belliarum TaxID=1033014 RepID=A0AAD6U5W5_9AGAR|nr:hypothetical protein B0H15DRAFT_1022637 [Mycena belliae]
MRPSRGPCCFKLKRTRPRTSRARDADKGAVGVSASASTSGIAVPRVTSSAVTPDPSAKRGRLEPARAQRRVHSKARILSCTLSSQYLTRTSTWTLTSPLRLNFVPPTLVARVVSNTPPPAFATQLARALGYLTPAHLRGGIPVPAGGIFRRLERAHPDASALSSAPQPAQPRAMRTALPAHPSEGLYAVLWHLTKLLLLRRLQTNMLDPTK